MLTALPGGIAEWMTLTEWIRDKLYKSRYVYGRGGF